MRIDGPHCSSHDERAPTCNSYFCSCESVTMNPQQRHNKTDTSTELLVRTHHLPYDPPPCIVDSATIVASYTANVIADAGADLITPGNRPL